MGVVIQFDRTRRKQRVTTEAERLRAMMEGKIETYVCNNCGGDIEVIDGNFPQKCPCCGTELEEWED